MFGLEIWQFWAAMGITLFAGFVKGAILVACTVLLFPDAYGVGDHALGLAAALAGEGHPVLVADTWGERRQPADTGQQRKREIAQRDQRAEKSVGDGHLRCW